MWLTSFFPRNAAALGKHANSDDSVLAQRALRSHPCWLRMSLTWRVVTMDRPRSMARMTEPTPARAAQAQRSSTPLVIASFLPLGFAIVLAVLAPGFYEPLLDDRVNVFGAPALVPFAGALLVLLAFNFLVIGFVRSSFVQGLIFAVTTTAGVFLVILAPAMARISVALDGVID